MAHIYHLHFLCFYYKHKRMPRTGIEPVTRGFSVLCSTDWAIWAWVAGTGFEPMTSGLWARRASRLLHPAIFIYKRCVTILLDKATPSTMGGEGFEPSKALPADLQSVPFGHSGIHPYEKTWQVKLFTKPMIGLEPITCWLQISCSANWATSAYSIDT